MEEETERTRRLEKRQGKKEKHPLTETQNHLELRLSPGTEMCSYNKAERCFPLIVHHRTDIHQNN